MCVGTRIFSFLLTLGVYNIYIYYMKVRPCVGVCVWIWVCVRRAAMVGGSEKSGGKASWREERDQGQALRATPSGIGGGGARGRPCGLRHTEPREAIVGSAGCA